MSDPVIAEVVIAAPVETVWRALREPAEIKRWFGWDHEGLDEEIRYIFVEHSTADDEAHVLDGGPGGTIALEQNPGKERRTLHVPASGEEWYGAENQRGEVREDGALVIRTRERVIVTEYE